MARLARRETLCESPKDNVAQNERRVKEGCTQRLLVYSIAPFGDFRNFDWQRRGALLFAVSYPLYVRDTNEYDTDKQCARARQTVYPLVLRDRGGAGVVVPPTNQARTVAWAG